MKHAFFIVLAGFLANSPGMAAETAIVIPSTFKRFAKAIHQVEASGRQRPPDGDHGRAIGPLQIHRHYWRDATHHNRSIGGTYQDCRNYNYAVKVLYAYLERFAPEALKTNDWQTCSKVHNGGPEGPLNSVTNSYWAKVRQYL